MLLGPEKRAGGGTGAAKAPASVQGGWWGPSGSGSLIKGREDISNLPLPAGRALGTAPRAGGQQRAPREGPEEDARGQVGTGPGEHQVWERRPVGRGEELRGRGRLARPWGGDLGGAP